MESDFLKKSDPLYIQIKNTIIKQIKENILNPGDKLPSERELCEEFNVSRITVRQALNELYNEGLIHRSHGKGTFVSDNKIEQELFSIIPFEHFIMSKGLKPQTRYLESKVVPNSYQLSKILDTPLSENIIELSLLGLGDKTPLALYTSCFPYELGIQIQKYAKQLNEKEKSFTTWDLYEYLTDIKLGVVNQTFEASIADPFISEILKIKKGNPILIAESIIYSADDKPLEYKTAIYRGDKYKFSLVRKPNI